MTYTTTLYLEQDLNDDSWRPFHEQLSQARQDDDGPIRLMLYGNGGNSDSVDALYDIITYDGNIDGYLIGCAYSAHSHLFAACQRRFVYPSSGIAIHEPRWRIYQDNEVDAHWLAQRIDRLSELSARQAMRYARASNKDIGWWLEQTCAAQYGYTYISASRMVRELEMAQWVPKRGTPDVNP